MKLYVLRHGETVWNAEGKLQGVSDIDLNENGVMLAKETSGGMKDIPLDLCITSPLKRAKRTAQLVLGDRRIPVIEDARVQEITFGAWEGLCCRPHNYEIPSPDFRLFFTDPFHYVPDASGETIEQLNARLHGFWEDITHREDYRDKSILISTHGCAGRALLYQLGDTTNFWRGTVPPNCSVSLLEGFGDDMRLVDQDHVYYDPSKVKDLFR